MASSFSPVKVKLVQGDEWRQANREKMGTSVSVSTIKIEGKRNPAQKYVAKKE